MTERPALPVASDGSDALQVAVRVAQAAGAEIERRLPDTIGAGAKERLGLTTKGGWNDRVTEVDKAAEDAALAVLTTAFPHHEIVGEESGAHGGDSPYRWYVDPIDGTRNFASGLPHICVSVGLWAYGEPTVGVLLDPIRRETFTAATGRGTAINGAPVTVSDESRMEEALLGFDIGYKGPEGKLLLAAVAELWPGFQSVRMMGSAALGITYAGCGRLELYAHHYVQPWDIAAAIVVVREAGGIATELNGGPLTPESRSIAAGAPRIHEQFLEATAGSLWRASAS
ncbi:MAG: inositol monophosphatase [Chloroflexi bacterium]|nr:inositol monophosphatase [Chloroflexota bacterium]